MRAGNRRASRPDVRAVAHCGRLGRWSIPAAPALRVAGCRRALVGLAAVLAIAVLAAAAPAPLPSPLEGPGHPDLKRRDTKRLERAIDALGAGSLDEASRLATKAGDSAARRLLELQLGVAGPGEPPLEELRSFCVSEPSYAAAWVTFSVAAEQAGAEADALASARRAAELWPGSPWATRVEELSRRWITDRLAETRELVAAGRPDDALELLGKALALAPFDPDVGLVKADVLIALGRTDEAEELLGAMGDEPEALMRRASLAELRHDLAGAMALYSSVPAGTPGRDEALQRVKAAWRRQNLSPLIQEALASSDLSRAELATVLIGLVPQAHALSGGQVPLLPDVVGLPSQREILTAVRIGLLPIDRVEQLFHPDRKVTRDEVRRAIDRLFRQLGEQPPRWCSDDAGASAGCIELPSPVSGAAVADIISRTADGEAP